MGKTALILQAFGIGDCIFAMGVAEHFRKKGYEIIWPVKPSFVEGLRRAYTNITFESDEKFDPNLFDIKEDKVVGGLRIIPIRWSHHLLGAQPKWWMRTKYDLYNLDYTKWKKHAKYARSPQKEKELFDLFGLKPDEPFNLINKTYRSNFTGNISIDLNNDFKNIEMSVVGGYSLFDWSLLIERATEIHVVNSASLYLLELLTLMAKEVHLYARIPDEVGFPYVDYLFTKPYILHE